MPVLPPDVLQAATKPRPGRPSKLTPKLIDDLCQPLRVCQPFNAACDSVGVSRTQAHAWLQEGARLQRQLAGEPGYGQAPDPNTLTDHQELLLLFSDAFARAVAEAKLRIGAGILRAGTATSTVTKTTTKVIGRDENGQPVYATETTTIEQPPDWRALESLGMRRFPEEFGTKQIVEVSGPEGAPIPLEVRAAEAVNRLRELRESGALRALPAPESADG